MKNILIAFCLVLFAHTIQAQIKVDTQGDVGIGVANPVKKLEVNGDTRFMGISHEFGRNATTQNVSIKVGGARAGNGTASFDLISDVTAYPAGGARFFRTATGKSTFVHHGTEPFSFQTSGAANFSFWTNGSELIRLHQNGNIGMGIGTPTTKLHVQGDITGAAFITSSDKRLKKSINSYSAGLDQILKIKPYSYYYNGEAGITSKALQFGIMAQDLEKIIPEAVSEYNYDALEKEGVEKSARTETFKAVNLSAITFAMVNSIKEQQVFIDRQNDKISELEQLVQDLSEKVTKYLIDDINYSEVDLDYDFVASLMQNSPNPFNGTTTIGYQLPSTFDSAELQIVNLAGELLKVVDLKKGGYGELKVNTFDFPTGTYTYSLIVNGERADTKKMVLTK